VPEVAVDATLEGATRGYGSNTSCLEHSAISPGQSQDVSAHKKNPSFNIPVPLQSKLDIAGNSYGVMVTLFDKSLYFTIL